MRALNDTLSQADRIGKVPHAKFPAILHLIERFPRPDSNRGGSAVPDRPPGASVEAGDCRATNGRYLEQFRKHILGVSAAQLRDPTVATTECPHPSFPWDPDLHAAIPDSWDQALTLPG